jgi:hypothetical protein
MKAGSGLVGIILTAIVIPLVAYLWKAHAESKRRRLDALLRANEQFRSAFLPSMAELSSPEPDIYSIISRSRGPHEVAILEFRAFLPSGRLRKFDKSVNKYRALRDSSMSTTRNDPSVGSKLLATMEELRSFAPPR